ncbi:ribosomal protection-like ABC-F family protein [Virgibacillus kimchii]
MIVCSIQNVTQIIGANTVFSGITAEMKQGDRIGLIGRNGEGKTTLLDLIAGKTAPSSGMITWKKGLSVELLEQQPNTNAEKNVESILYEVFASIEELKIKMSELEQEMAVETNSDRLSRIMEKYGLVQETFQQEGGYEMDAQVRRIMSGLHIEKLAKKEWQQLSGGERTKIGLAKLLLAKPDLLLLDEPTNHLDLPAIEWLTNFIRQYDGTVIIVSHDRYFLDETATSILEMDQGELIKYHTNYTGYVKEREERLLREFQQYEDQQKKIKKMKETIKRLKEWANQASPPNDGLHRRAKSMEKALARIEVKKRPVMDQKKIGLDFKTNKRSGNDVVIMEAVSKSFGDRPLFSGLDMHVQFQERIAIVGENGIGKSTLLNMLLGAEEADSGEIKLGSNLSVGFLTQHMAEIDEDCSILEAFRKEVPVTEGEARHILAKFLFYGKTVFQKVGSMSGGEKMRLRLAQLVYQNHNLLILDEPTNHLDIESKEVLEDALEQFNGTVLAVSHDRYFLDKIFPVTYWLVAGKLTRYEGNYTYAREKGIEL